jgi:hypothetical protein
MGKMPTEIVIDRSKISTENENLLLGQVVFKQREFGSV